MKNYLKLENIIIILKNILMIKQNPKMIIKEKNFLKNFYLLCTRNSVL